MEFTPLQKEGEAHTDRLARLEIANGLPRPNN